jgi:hypothetical protein
MVDECDDAKAATWVAQPSFSADTFALALRDDPSLCVVGDGGQLRIAPCVKGSASQLFRLNKTSSGVDIHGVDPACPCWNVQDNNARDRHGKGPGNGAVIQCFSCVDGTNFNPNQRFQLDDASGEVQAWDGYAKGACVTVDYAGNPLPPAPPAPPPPGPRPWYLAEDYADRHGSFLK